EATGAAHFYALRDAPGECAARPFVVMREQAGEGAVGAAGGGIFRHAAHRSEHTRPNVEAVTHARVKIDVRQDTVGVDSFEAAHVDFGALECNAVVQLYHEEGQPNGRDLRRVRLD